MIASSIKDNLKLLSAHRIYANRPPLRGSKKKRLDHSLQTVRRYAAQMRGGDGEMGRGGEKRLHCYKQDAAARLSNVQPQTYKKRDVTRLSKKSMDFHPERSVVDAICL
jgi:hypothetical protein